MLVNIDFIYYEIVFFIVNCMFLICKVIIFLEKVF